MNIGFTQKKLFNLKYMHHSQQCLASRYRMLCFPSSFKGPDELSEYVDEENW
jgi:hypothetical protein